MNRVQLYDPSNRKYLHVSGEYATDENVWAWTGSPLQAGVLRRRALNARELWPYVVIPLIETKKPDTCDAGPDSETTA